MEDIYQHLARLRLVPSTGHRHLYFTYNGRRIDWDATVDSLGLGSMSHLHLKLSIPGGAKSGFYPYSDPFTLTVLKNLQEMHLPRGLLVM